ncbi:MAG: serine hydrolase [Tahibacter sp.]
MNSVRLSRLALCLLGAMLLAGGASARTPRKAHGAARPALHTPIKSKTTRTHRADLAMSASLVAVPPGDAAHLAATDMAGWLDAVQGSGLIAGLAVAVVDNDQVLLQRGVGFADASTQAPVTPDTVFRLASLSKSFAATLAGLLINDGYLSWDTRVGSVLPTFALKDAAASEQLTIRDILSHRVGLPHNTYDGLLEQDEPYELLVDRLRDVDPICHVGDCYSYQNIAFSLLGDVTYAVTGDFFYHQVEKRVFHPLGMNTATYGRDSLEASSDWARPHVRRGRNWQPFQPRESYYHVAPAAGVNASIKDMTQYLIAQMGGRPDVLPQTLLDTLHTPLVATPTELRASPWRRGRLLDAEYALGWRIYNYAGETLIFHAGAVQGYRGIIAFLPKQKFGAVMLWNCESALPTGLLPMLLDRYLGLPQVDWAGVEALDTSSTSIGGER